MSTRTLSEARDSLRKRGFSYLEDDFLNDALNQAKNTLEDLYPFPWLVTTTQGTTPFVIADLKLVLTVFDPVKQVEIPGMRFQDIVDIDPGLIGSGDTQFWYMDDGYVNPGDYQPAIGSYPANNGQTLFVQYVKFSPELVNDTDRPLFPDSLNKLWQDIAIIECYNETFNFQAAQVLWNDLQNRKIPELIKNYEIRNRMNPEVQTFSVNMVSTDS